MTGIGTTSELQDVYRLIDVSVLTSKSEGFPNVVMEAMASGTPVVAANVGGVPELIRHGVTGTLIDDREPKSFADAIEYFLDHADVATEVADRAYKYVCEDLSLDAMVSGYKKVYDGLKSYLEESSMRCFRLAGALTLILYGVGAAGQAIDYSQYLGEHWYGLYITGKKAGYSMSLVTADEAGVVTVVEDATFKLNMAGIKQDMRVYSKRRYGQDGALLTIESAVDDIAGRNRFDAVIEGEELILTSTVGGQKSTRRFPKPAETLQAMLKFTELLAGDPQPGDSATFSMFEPMYQMEIEGEVIVLGKEERMFDGVNTEVYRVKSVLKTMGIESIGFVTAEGVTLEDKIAGGIITMRLEPKEIAQDVHYTNDTIVSNAALVDKSISDPRTRESLRLKVSGPLGADVLFNDERQTFSKRVDSYTFVGKKLTLDGFDAPTLPIDEPSVRKWQEPTLFVQSDNPKLIEQARAIIGDETDSAAASEALCRWVYKNMKATFSARLTNSLEVLENMEGDCTEHSMLFIGLARAIGLPAHEAAGLIYVEGSKRGFYFHQWARVWVGQWIDVDPTFDQPIADATHIKLAEGDLFEQTKILPVIGQLSIEVLE